jgi:ribosomal protein L37AE/L43A
MIKRQLSALWSRRRAAVSAETPVAESQFQRVGVRDGKSTEALTSEVLSHGQLSHLDCDECGAKFRTIVDPLGGEIHHCVDCGHTLVRRSTSKQSGSSQASTQITRQISQMSSLSNASSTSRGSRQSQREKALALARSPSEYRRIEKMLAEGSKE